MKYRLVGLVCLILLSACQTASQSGGKGLNVARFNPAGQLLKPDVTEWVFMGSSLGLLYASGEFRNDRPGTFQIVHMEPAAYRFFLENGEFADGSMMAMSFYTIQEKPQPALNGFAQDDYMGMEIHLLDSHAFNQQRAFFHFNPGETVATMVPADNECIGCHLGNGAYNGVFTQFYPPIRGREQRP